MNATIPTSGTKADIFAAAKHYLATMDLAVVSIDDQRPWGGFFVLDSSQVNRFAELYFPDHSLNDIQKGGGLSPKILLVEPGKKLSWQYHSRRQELWHVINGPVGVITSQNDEQGAMQELASSKEIQFGALVRHRLIGLETWGVVAEIWQHTQADTPSDEADIVRVADEFGRANTKEKNL